MKAVFFCWNKKRHMPDNKQDLNAGKNPMAAQMACIELEKQLTFIALTQFRLRQ